MSQAALGRAHLLRILAHLPRAEWSAAAAAAGYVPHPSAPRVEPPPFAPEPAVTVAPPTPAPEPDPFQPGDLPDLPFWRIAASRELSAEEWPEGAPAWLEQTAPWCDQEWQSDPTIPVPVTLTLAPRARQSSFLRRHLVLRGQGTAVDLERLCRRLAERRAPARLPRLERQHWPGRVSLILDLARELTPYHAEFWRWAALLRHTLGARLTLYLARDGHPDELEDAARGQPARLPRDATPLMVLSDAGLYAPDSPRRQRWLAFAGHHAHARPWLLAPCPPRMLGRDMADRFHCVLLERGAPLHPVQSRRAAASSTASPASADLLAALLFGARTEPPLLRALRIALMERGADIGCEYETWNHPGVIADELACALRPEARAEAEGHLARLPISLRQELLRLRREGNRHLSPLIHLEETLAAGEPATQSVRRYAATLAQSGGERHPLARYLAGLARRRPHLLVQQPELALAWGLAHREQLRSGRLRQPPPGLDLRQLDWLMGEQARRPVTLGQIGTALGVFDLASDSTARPACPLAELEMAGEYWQVEQLHQSYARSRIPGTSPEGGREQAPLAPWERGRGEGAPVMDLQRPDASTPQLLPLAATVLFDPAQRYRLTLGRRQLNLEAVTRPAWAVGMGRDGDGLFAELKDGRRVYWVGRGVMPVSGLTVTTDSFGEELTKVKTFPGGLSFDLPHGYWWDELEFRAYLEAGRALLPPPWAVRHGVDEYGYWAEFQVKGVVQRMRWIPPGEFLMGSLEDEPERFPDETQHPVLLTQGTWLANTACTQALWRAVLVEALRRYKGDGRPVVKVNWDDVAERFLPELNRLVPGLEAVLPSEAQWEYACRAGTTTPFSFGENITPEQVNYNGNYPYAGGTKGKYRGQAVDVRVLPANDWGLFQMHGNVWEWCADWLGEYPHEATVDPVGPSAGRGRVLRGGSWIFDGRGCRSAYRNGYEPGDRSGSIGFRLARGFSPRPAASGGVAGVVDGGGAPASAPDSPSRGLGNPANKSIGKARKK